MEFKTAVKMRQITEDAWVSRFEEIMEDIELYAKLGKNEYFFGGTLNCAQIDKLEELGYKVETGYEFNQPWAKIKW